MSSCLSFKMINLEVITAPHMLYLVGVLLRSKPQLAANTCKALTAAGA